MSHSDPMRHNTPLSWTLTQHPVVEMKKMTSVSIGSLNTDDIPLSSLSWDVHSQHHCHGNSSTREKHVVVVNSSLTFLFFSTFQVGWRIFYCIYILYIYSLISHYLTVITALKHHIHPSVFHRLVPEHVCGGC